MPLPPTIAILRRFYPENYGDPLKPIRIIGGIFPGNRSDEEAVVAGLLAHLLISAALGAIFTGVVDRFAGRRRVSRACWGAALGTAQWLVSYYAFLSWFYPEQVRADPLWVAASSHAGFGAAVAAIT